MTEREAAEVLIDMKDAIHDAVNDMPIVRDHFDLALGIAILALANRAYPKKDLIEHIALLKGLGRMCERNFSGKEADELNTALEMATKKLMGAYKLNE